MVPQGQTVLGFPEVDMCATYIPSSAINLSAAAQRTTSIQTSTTLTREKQQSMSSPNVHEANMGAGLLIPHTAYNKKGEKLSSSSRTPLAPPFAVIPVEEPKRKKRKYHPELVNSGLELPLNPRDPLAPTPSQSQPQSRQGEEFPPAPETEWDDGIYIGVNNHPLFDISAVPADSDDLPGRKVRISITCLFRCNGF